MTEKYSEESVRLREAKFPGEDEDDVVDDVTDVLMTPADSEVDENENTPSRWKPE